MKALSAAALLTVSDSQVLVAGDWHGDIDWVSRALPQVRGVSRTLLHLGNFAGEWEQFLPAVDYWAANAGIERVLVTPGNHEPWAQLTELYSAHPGCAIQVSNTVWALPRPFRFTLGPWEYKVLSLGGAASEDFPSRHAGVDWFPEETITSSLAAEAIAGGPADIMLTHETVNGSGVLPVEMALASNPDGWPEAGLFYSATTRARVTDVWHAVRPELLLHGHRHVRGSGRLQGSRSVEAMDRNGRQGNLAVLDATTLTVTDVSLRPALASHR